MPIPKIFAGLVLVFGCVTFAAIYGFRNKEKLNFEKRWLNILVFILCLISLVISIGLFRNMGSYADEYGSSPVLISGGWFWLYMDWIRLALLLVLSVISGIKVFTQSTD